MMRPTTAHLTLFASLTIVASACLAGEGECANDWIARIESDDPGDAGQFGIAIDMNSSVALVAEQLHVSANYRGRVHVIEPSDSSRITTFYSSGHSPADYFGDSIDIDGNLAVIGAPREESSYGGRGAAYLFDISDPANPVELSRVGNAYSQVHWWGRAVAISGDRMLIGAWAEQVSGRAHLYDISDPANPVLVRTLQAPDTSYFGVAVAIGPQAALVGDNGAFGAVYEFDRVTGDFVSEIHGPGASGDAFGGSVEVAGRLAYIGAPGDDERGTGAGAIFVYDLDTGSQLMKIMGDDTSTGDELGNDHALRVVGDYIVAGAPNRDEGSRIDVGGAYVFDRATGVQLAQLRSDAARPRGELGYTVAANGSRVFAGAPFDDLLDYQSGAVHIFESCVGGTACTGDIDGDGGVNIADLIAVLTAWGPCEGCPEDLDGDGFVTFADLIEVLAGWGPCP